MTNPRDEGTNVWNFPELTSDSTQGEDDEDEFVEEIHANIDDLTTTPISKTEDVKQNTLEDELEALKAIYEKKILTASKLISKLNDTKPFIDNEVMDYIEDIIKKVCKKIIYKEIEVDPQLLIEMVTELKKQFNNQSCVVMVHLSKADFDRLDLREPEAGAVFSVQNDLNEGDIIIKCNAAEIHAQLTDRIERLLRKEP